MSDLIVGTLIAIGFTTVSVFLVICIGTLISTVIHKGWLGFNIYWVEVEYPNNVPVDMSKHYTFRTARKTAAKKIMYAPPHTEVRIVRGEDYREVLKVTSLGER